MMSLSIAILFVLAGLVVLAFGGEMLVRGAIKVSKRLNISPVVIGLTIVALATSLPELAVSLMASLRGSPDVAVGNVVGSNMFNIAVILGVTALLFPPLVFRSTKLRFDVATMMAASALLVALGWTGTIARLEGLVLLVGLVVYLWIRVRGTRSGDDMEEFDDSIAQTNLELHTPKRDNLWLSFILIIVGAGMLTGGAELLVRGATGIARYAGVSERVIAITLVSAGTGLPELTTAIIAGARKHPSVAIGNVIGSNIFNVLGILGTVALVGKVPASPKIIQVDAIWMLGFSGLLLVPLFKPGRQLSRFEGLVLLAAYGFYLYILFVSTSTVASNG
jgi:cation:H+ antiporter